MSEESKLADALSALTRVLEKNAKILELLSAGITPATEARILGVSTRTISRRRKARKSERLLS